MIDGDRLMIYLLSFFKWDTFVWDQFNVFLTRFKYLETLVGVQGVGSQDQILSQESMEEIFGVKRRH